MELTKEYLKENEDVVFRNFKQINSHRKSPRVLKRIQIIKDFCKGAKKILSVGCGPYEPIEINATHACDIVSNSEKYLKELGWKGIFFIASCDDIGSFDTEFDVAVCQEVIEHLPELEDVKKTFLELNRVAKRWIVTSPLVKGTELTHKRGLTLKQLQEFTKGMNVQIKNDGWYWYVTHSSSKIN